MLSYEEQKQQDRQLNKKLMTTKNSVMKSLRNLAEKHDIVAFINKAPKLVRKVRDISDDIQFKCDYQLRQKAIAIFKEVEEYNNSCWQFAQGDTRVIL